MKISCQSCGAKYNIADEKVRGKVVKIACKKCGARIEIDGREQAAQQEDQDETRVYDQAQAPAGEAMWTVSVDDNDQREVTTAGLVELVRGGTISVDTFVWRDGMADWQAIREIEELGAHFGGGAPEIPATNARGGSDMAAPAASPFGGGAPEAAGGARLGGGRRGGGVDLFAAPTGGATEEEDVATSAPSAGVAMAGPAAAAAGGKPTGARNENSVLFSLSALTASGGSASASSAASSDGEKSGLIDIQKLAASAKPGGKDDGKAKLDDIMNLSSGGAFGSALGAPILAPPPAEALTAGPSAEPSSGKKSNMLLFVVIGLGVAVVALLLVLVLGKKSGDETASKKDDKVSDSKDKSDDKDKKDKGDDTKKVASASSGDPGKSSDPGGAAPAPSDTAGGGKIGTPGTKPGAGATGGTTAPAAGGGTPAAGGGTPAAGATDKPAGGATPGKKCSTLEECMKEKGGAAPAGGGTPTPPPASGGGGAFDTGAAKASLGSVPYKDCGSGGPGKVAVTFGPSGSVTSAAVTSGDYDAATKNCVAGRFRGAKVPAFDGTKTVGWSINL